MPDESTEGAVPIDEKWRKSLAAELARIGADPEALLNEMGFPRELAACSSLLSRFYFLWVGCLRLNLEVTPAGCQGRVSRRDVVGG